MSDRINDVVLVHGGFVDGSGWQQVHGLLVADGYRVTVVQHPTRSLVDDVAVTRRAVDAVAAPVVLVGHCYGGAVITEAGDHPAVRSLVYVAAFAPDVGESVNSLMAGPLPDAPAPPIEPAVDGFLFFAKDRFAAAFAADVPDTMARFLADAQVPWGVDALAGEITHAAWRDKPSWYLVALEDRMIPPPAQRAMADRAGSAAREVRASHALVLSRPDAVAEVISQAART